MIFRSDFEKDLFALDWKFTILDCAFTIATCLPMSKKRYGSFLYFSYYLISSCSMSLRVTRTCSRLSMVFVWGIPFLRSLWLHFCIERGNIGFFDRLRWITTTHLCWAILITAFQWKKRRLRKQSKTGPSFWKKRNFYFSILFSLFLSKETGPYFAKQISWWMNNDKDDSCPILLVLFTFLDWLMIIFIDTFRLSHPLSSNIQAFKGSFRSVSNHCWGWFFRIWAFHIDLLLL